MDDKWLGAALDYGEKLVVKRLGGISALSWVQAVYLYDNGDPSMVALMIERDHTAMLLDENVKLFLASVVTGERRSVVPPNFKGDAKGRLDSLLKILYVGETISDFQKQGHIDYFANPAGFEVGDMVKHFALVRNAVYKIAEERAAIGEATRKKSVADLKKRIKKYPQL